MSEDESADQGENIVQVSREGGAVQHAVGGPIAQAWGERANAIVNIRKFYVREPIGAFLIVSIIIQVIGYAIFLPGLFSRMSGFNILAFLAIVVCYPLLFGPLSLFGLVRGLSQRKFRIVALSLVCGFLSVCMHVPLYFIRAASR